MTAVSTISTSRTQARLRDLLAEMVQADQADLDFGIYRIMRLKRAEFLRFLTDDLFPQVQAALSAHIGDEAGAVKADLDKAEAAARDLGMDPAQSPKVKELREKYRTLGGDASGAEDEIFSALFDFFRRYYDKGDFLALPRYKAGVYSIPYSGEEVKLHWANADQYYVKSSESFRDYAFTLPDGRTVHFRLSSADTETDNNKAAPDKDRVFLLAPEDPITEEDNALIIRFHYQADPNKRKQAALNAEAGPVILAALRALSGDVLSALAGTADMLPSWADALAAPRPTEKNKERTLLDLKLADYTARNSVDYFIHKDLGGFLRRELDFFLKNEVLHLDDWDRVEPADAVVRLRRLSVIRGIAQKIIAFLAQTENLQKRLWLKKKFVVGGGWCVTLDRVPAALYPQVAANEAQRAEWVRLFAIDEIAADTTTPAYSEPLTVDFLTSNTSLVLDTQFFNASFTDALLSDIKDLDAETDGIIVNSENFQALNLLNETYHSRVKCVHIDPPYNTATSGFLYKNGYKHSSWLSMMENRIRTSLSYLADDGSYLCHIDENEYEYLHLLFESFLLLDAGTVIWDKRNPMNGGSGVAKQHEYILWLMKQAETIYLQNTNVQSILDYASELVKEAGAVTDHVRSQFSQWITRNAALSGGEKAYKNIDDEGLVYQSVSLRAPEPRADPKFHQPFIHPVTKKPCPVPANGFSRTPETLQEMNNQGKILFGKDETVQPRQKVTLLEDSRRQMSSVIQNAKKGKEVTDALGVDFPYCHPPSLYEELIGAVTHAGNEYILDFFAGSGTTGQAVINLNRNDAGRRKYILIEMGQYFDTVLKPRLQKVIYSKDWKAGKPLSREGSSHLLRYLKLESYEDTLNNLTLHRTLEQEQAIAEAPPAAREDYLLRYMLHNEARDSMLSARHFADPFGYKMRIATDSAGDTRETPVDLVETFHWLLGMRVQRQETREGVRLSWGRLPDDRQALILWRCVADLDADALDDFFRRHGLGNSEDAPGVIYVNGDNTLRRHRPEGQNWRVELIEPEFLRLMFGETDPFVVAEGA